MLGRKTMLAGAAVTASATVVVGALVVLSNAAALADSAGRPLAVAPIVVSAPTATRTAAPVVVAQPAVAPVTVTPLVPAPVPVPDVVAAPAERAAPQPEPVPAVPAVTVPDVAAEGPETLEGARDWAAAQGWDTPRIDAWLAQMRERIEDGRRAWQSSVDSTGTESVPESPSFRFGSKEEQSPDISLQGD